MNVRGLVVLLEGQSGVLLSLGQVIFMLETMEPVYIYMDWFIAFLIYKGNKHWRGSLYDV